LQMGEETGAKSVDLEWVQVHPMGLAKPDDADAKMKFLAAEAAAGGNLAMADVAASAVSALERAAPLLRPPVPACFLRPSAAWAASY